MKKLITIVLILFSLQAYSQFDYTFITDTLQVTSIELLTKMTYIERTVITKRGDSLFIKGKTFDLKHKINLLGYSPKQEILMYSVVNEEKAAIYYINPIFRKLHLILIDESTN